MRVTVLIPTYNEAENIGRVCRSVRLAVPDAHILVIDDNSPDGTADLVEALRAEVDDLEVMRRSNKSGLGDAYRGGLRHAIDAGAEICAHLDADLSHDPVVLPALIAVIGAGADLAIGSRYVPGGATENWPRRRRLLSRWGNRYVAGVLGLAVNDATGGFRAWRTEALVAMEFEALTATGYGFQIEMTHRLVSIGGKVVEFPITFRDRTEGTSKMSGGIVREALMLVPKLWLDDFRGRRHRRGVSR